MDDTLPWDALFAAADAAKAHAHAPYSRFPVGAAVLTEDGRIFAGANMENASYGLSMCAERNAIGQAISQGQRKVLAVAIVTEAKAPCPPCGACRQVIAEFGAAKTPVRSRAPSGDETRHTLAELLPNAFTPEFL